MKAVRNLYEMMKAASVAHAKWDYETSMNILRSKKRMTILLLLAVPAVLFSVAYAADALPDILGGHKAYAPAYYDTKIFLISTLIGMAAGLITGCIGAGGGFIITPALMSAGVKGILAVGTDLFHIFAKAIMGTVVHKKLGNVSVTLAVAFLVGSGVGVSVGGLINRALYEMNPVLSDTFISLVYVVLLGFLGVYSAMDFIKQSKSGVDSGAHGPEPTRKAGGKKSLPEVLQASNIPPMITFDEDLVPGGKKIPALYVALSGVLVGFAAAIMGVGGGFLTFPIFVYMLGVSSFTTVGTDILQIIFTAGYASIAQYAIYGFIFYTLAMGMLLGSLLGIQIGALTTKVVKGIYIRGFYAMAIVAGFTNRLFALPGKLSEMELIHLSPSTTHVIDLVGSVVFYLAVAGFALWVFAKFFGSMKLLREEA